MSYPRYVQDSTLKWEKTDMDAICDHVLAGDSLSGYLAYPYKYLIRSLAGGIYDAIDATGNRVYGGPDDTGGATGTNPASVWAATITAAAGALIAVEEGVYEMTELAIDVPVHLQGLGHVVITPAGNHPAFAIDLLAVYNTGVTGQEVNKKVIMRDLDFDGSNTTDEALIEFTHSTNVSNVIVKFENLYFSQGYRGIYQNSDKIWWALGCIFQNIRTYYMTGASIYIQCAPDLTITAFEVYNSFQTTTEPNAIINCIQAATPFASGNNITGLTILGTTGGTVTHSVELQNKAAHITNLEIDTSDGDGLYINGTYNTITNFEVAGHRGTGVIVDGNWNIFVNGEIRENYEHGLVLNSGGYLQIQAVNFVNNGKEADATYNDIYILDNQGANCIISATCNNANTNRTNYGAYLGTSSYGVISLATTGLRAGAIYYHTTKLWAESSLTGGTLTKPNKFTWLTTSQGFLTDTDRSSSMGDYTSIDLTSRTSASASGAILQVRITPSVVPASGYIVIYLRSKNATSSEPINIILTVAQATASVGAPYQVTVGLDSGQNLDYKIELSGAWTATTTMYVLGYYD